jgi:hypothetical protein
MSFIQTVCGLSRVARLVSAGSKHCGGRNMNIRVAGLARASTRAFSSSLGGMRVSGGEGNSGRTRTSLCMVGGVVSGCGAAWLAMAPTQRRASCDAPAGTKVRMALCQIGVTADKAANIYRAKVLQFSLCSCRSPLATVASSHPCTHAHVPMPKQTCPWCPQPVFDVCCR